MYLNTVGETMKKLLIPVLFLFSTQTLASFTPYLGLNGGYNSSKGDNLEDSKNGPSVQGKILGSWEFDSVYVDLSAGYQWMDLKSENIKVNTRSGTAELEVRYKLSDSWSFGPAVRATGGTDNTNSETLGSESVTTSILGKLIYQTFFGSLPGRIELGGGSSVGLDRNLTTVFLGFQVALPWSHPKEVAQREVVVMEDTVAQPPPIVAQVAEPIPDIKVDLKMARIRFDVDKASISFEDEAKLAKLAQFLKYNNEDWGRIKISGHTDITGEPLHNKKLSQDRADAVMKIFIKYGVIESKLSANGYGSSLPLVNEKNHTAYEKNRRTEIEFYGVKNRDHFNQLLTESLK
jgi:outer membrane protein OmpA-like peptidoglycan-associated protein